MFAQSRTTRPGYCLLELAAALALVAILAVASVPVTKGILAGGALTREAKELEGTLQMLALQAKQKEEELILTILEYEYSAHSQTHPERLLAHQVLKSHVKLELNETPLTLHFYPSGAVSPATLRLRLGTKHCLIKLSLRGRVKRLC